MHPHTCFQCDHEYIFLFRHDLIVSFLLRKGYLSGTYLNMCVFNFSANLTGWNILNFRPTSKFIKNSVGKIIKKLKMILRNILDAKLIFYF